MKSVYGPAKVWLNKIDVQSLGWIAQNKLQNLSAPESI
jgi:hypothetical protein